jgi:adenosylcobyric acid synthase
MVQGTGSSVGKSLLVAALCRILHQDGLRVAPFKAQNMSLNAAVTLDGGEIGRATAVQAAAAGVEPIVEMNPILLKPEADTRCQVVVLGRPEGISHARDYAARKPAYWTRVTGALDRLRAEFEVVVIEGAGSPAEINLRSGDIVNMAVALHARAPVLLAGDIDRGGVFASLVGTMELLEAGERALVKAFVINKFRGDRALLEPGLDMLTARTHVPVLGVIPYLHNLLIAEEDGVALEQQSGTAAPGVLDIAVLRLPHIANFDDFDLLAAEPALRLRYVTSPRDLGRPDLIVLPGTKSTIADLAFLRESGLAARLCAEAHHGKAILGICGGYQMLGETLEDPDGIESSLPTAAGLGLLPVRTRFEAGKRTVRVRASAVAGPGPFARMGKERIDAYEIHMGRTTGTSIPVFYAAGDDEPPCLDGCQSEDGRVVGTYLHGLFENHAARRALIEWLGARRGLRLETGEVPAREQEYDRLASAVRAELDMALVYDLLERGA